MQMHLWECRQCDEMQDGYTTSRDADNAAFDHLLVAHYPNVEAYDVVEAGAVVLPFTRLDA